MALSLIRPGCHVIPAATSALAYLLACLFFALFCTRRSAPCFCHPCCSACYRFTIQYAAPFHIVDCYCRFRHLSHSVHTCPRARVTLAACLCHHSARRLRAALITRPHCPMPSLRLPCSTAHCTARAAGRRAAGHNEVVGYSRARSAGRVTWSVQILQKGRSHAGVASRKHALR